jgi:hypothetical protein
VQAWLVHVACVAVVAVVAVGDCFNPRVGSAAAV